MSSSTAEPQRITAAVVTVSDSCARGEREDRSGPAVAQALQKVNLLVTIREVVADDPTKIQNLLIRLAREVRGAFAGHEPELLETNLSGDEETRLREVFAED